MTTYFTNCRTAEELKKEYKKVAVKLHPDNNHGKDTTKEFQMMQEEFEIAWSRLKDIHVNKDGETYTKETSETARSFMDLINKLIQLEGVEVELCGSWIWVTGNTKAYKDVIKSFGFRWSHNKQAWYFHLEPYRKRSKKDMTLDDIRKMYGSERFTGAIREPEAIPAF